MPELKINVEGTGGGYADVFKEKRMINLPDSIPILMETLDGGMSSGKPSIAFIIEIPGRREVLLAQTSLRLFQMAAVATLAKYGDLTEGAFLSHVSHGQAKMILSDLVNCAKCSAPVPSSCKFCMECGNALASRQ